ncbi:MAG: hypothetical protein KDE54_29075, partial [Caldilineaceae bacterium]|nr:hypothetical protein [Caldilineaceae bacterium]
MTVKFAGPKLNLLFCCLSLLIAWAFIWPRGGFAQGGAVPTRNAAISLAVMPGEPNHVLAGVINSPDPPTIFYSLDGAVSWRRADRGLPENISIAGLAFDPQNPDLVLAGDGGFGLLFRSLDGGRTWNESPAIQSLLTENSAVGELIASVQDQRTVFYASTRWDGVFRSVDGGVFWEKLDGGLVGEARRVREVAVYEDVVYAGTHNGLYRLLPTATAWEQVTGFPVT